ncbi:TetR family transcriptional regulator [Streptomyces sp. NPDC094049]|uniref:TetR/AcrR family transcriptional regulator n=1 Tax=Streptomyces sp. NPDC094049 TaxID=3154987 RepID=UPI0033211AE2
MEEKARKGERTRRRILEAARHEFALQGYERATIRGIAAAAECDKSSVIKYFGTKQQLFREAVEWQASFDASELKVSDQQAEDYLRSMLADFAGPRNDPMFALLRSAMTNEEAAQLLREKTTTGAVDPLAEALDGPDARLRAALVSAAMFGIAVQREMLRMPYIAEADLEDVLRLSGPMLRQLLEPQPQPEPGEGRPSGS